MGNHLLQEDQIREVYGKIAPLAVSDAAKQNINLDYSVASLKTVDSVLEALHSEYAASQDSRTSKSKISYTGYAEMFGCYMLAVVDKNKIPGKLTIVNDQYGTAYGFTFANGAFSDFVSWCMKAIANGKDDAIWPKYLFFSRSEQESSS